MKNYITKPIKKIGRGITMLGLSALVVFGSQCSKYTNNVQEIRPKSYDCVGNIMKDIKSGNINSYSELIQKTKGFSEDQKLSLVGTIGETLAESYEGNKTFFEQLSDLLKESHEEILQDSLNESQNIEKILQDYQKEQGFTNFSHSF